MAGHCQTSSILGVIGRVVFEKLRWCVKNKKYKREAVMRVRGRKARVVAWVEKGRYDSLAPKVPDRT